MTNERPAEKGPETGLAAELTRELGPAPEALEKPLDWAGREQEELVQAAAAAAPEEDPSFWQKAGRKIRSRVVVTGLAMATLMPMLAPSAEAGERGSGWRKAGTIVSIAAGVGERILAQREYEHVQKARRMEFQLRMLENEGERIVRRAQMVNERLTDMQMRLDGEKNENRRNYLEQNVRRLELEKENLKERAVEIDAQVAKLGPAFQKEADAAGKSGLFRELAQIAGSAGQQMRWGGY